MIRLAHGSTLLTIMSSYCVLMWFDECVLSSVVRILGFKTTFMRELPNGDTSQQSLEDTHKLPST